MMRHLGISMEVTCKTTDVLSALRKNRDGHGLMVTEARAGYVDKALAAMTKRIGELREGKLASCSFDLHVPVDYTRVYDTAIHMLERHTGAEVTLSADEFRHLVDDEWDWADKFAAINAAYSSSTRAWAASKVSE